ncbi:MAG TPA: recombinase family protein [Rhizomicrobium sp.]|nr:recombinase family protein [Rhizomicrobium sp.]
MKKYFGYIRVSTQRQGAHGVSLQEQKGAIETYAQRTGLEVVAWYEERETAAKRGRRVFTRMLAELGRDRAQGIIIHKIDRSARNLRDWADLGELIDRGIDVHFAHDALDLRSRGGRLSADIQAVVAADFIRNLREETRKGFYGRLKQGIYPLRAPIGYRDMGRGKPKEIDPVRGPHVRETFELYATGEWNFHTLQAEMHRRGLRGLRHTPVSLNGLTTMLNNPFYMGLIHVRKTNETFEGKHKPLISKVLYDRVQAVLRERRNGVMPLKYDFLFRRMIHCAHCACTLIGERQKGRYVYYRCHGSACAGTIVNEARIDERLHGMFSLLRFTDGDLRDLRDMVEKLRGAIKDEKVEREQSLRLQLSQLDERISRLTDALIDGLIDKPTFDTRKITLLHDRRGILDRLERIESEPSVADVIVEYLELSNVAQIQYESVFLPERRETICATTSNFLVAGKTPEITLKSPFQELYDMRISACCDLYRDDSRTLAQKVFEIFKTTAEADVAKQTQRNQPDENLPMAA